MDFEQIEKRDRLPVRTLTEEEIREVVEAVYSNYKPQSNREIVMNVENSEIFHKAFEECWDKRIKTKEVILDETLETKPFKITSDTEGNIIDIK